MADDFQDSEDLQNELPQADSSQTKSNVLPIWAISAKIVEETASGFAGRETRRGTRKFNANQKVYLWDYPSGNQWPKVDVIGRYRAKYKYINVMVDARYLIHFRAEMLYSPT